MAISPKMLRAAVRESKTPNEVCERFRQLAREHGELGPGTALRYVRKLGFRKETTLRFIDSLTLCHGVESFESRGGFWDYVNTGDSYACTVLLSPGGRFLVKSWGDVAEQPSHMKWAERRH